MKKVNVDIANNLYNLYQTISFSSSITCFDVFADTDGGSVGILELFPEYLDFSKIKNYKQLEDFFNYVDDNNQGEFLSQDRLVTLFEKYFKVETI